MSKYKISFINSKAYKIKINKKILLIDGINFIHFCCCLISTDLVLKLEYKIEIPKDTLEVLLIINGPLIIIGPLDSDGLQINQS